MEGNLANLLRPKSLEEFIGQNHIIGEDKTLFKLIKQKQIPHLFFYGRPGSGKTSLAKIIAKETDYQFYSLNATSLKIEELRTIFKKHQDALIKPLIFIDEVHRLSKTQQEVLLPVMESYEVIIIGASTENPFFTLTNGIRSRSFLFEFLPLTEQDLDNVISKAIAMLDIKLEKDAKEFLITTSNGDARALLNLLDFSAKVNKEITKETLKELRQAAITDGVSSNDAHYDLASALIKSIRGSDIDAGLYYLARLIEAGESVEFIARRLVILASEDIGNANPHALNLATSTFVSGGKIGFPEARILLGQCVVYLCSSPKSNSSYNAINSALQYVKHNPDLKVPKHIKDHPIGYKYPHDFNGYVEQTYLKKNLKFYETKEIGYEKTLSDWLSKIYSTNKV